MINEISRSVAFIPLLVTLIAYWVLVMTHFRGTKRQHAEKAFLSARSEAPAGGDILVGVTVRLGTLLVALFFPVIALGFAALM